LAYGRWQGRPCFWVADDFNTNEDVIHLIDPNNGLRIDKLTEVPEDITDLAFGDGDAWCLTRPKSGQSKQEKIYRISANDGKVVYSFDSPVIDGGFQSIAFHEGHLWLHAVNSGKSGFYKINPGSGTDKDTDRGTVVARFHTPALKAWVQGLCNDPKGQMWLLDADGRWVRPLKVDDLEEFPDSAATQNPRTNPLRNVASHGPFGLPQTAARTDVETLISTQPAFQTRVRQLQPGHSETRSQRGPSNDGQSLTQLGPQLESRIGTPIKVLRDLNLLRGRGTPPNRLLSNAFFSGVSVLRNIDPLL
jgi:hypothetical protein